jgi:acylphosphatase
VKTGDVRAHIVVTGRVQGVFYRGSAQQEGRRLGLVGQIRNLPDGSVEAVVEGPRASVDAFVAWCRRGPEMADVEDVAVEIEPAKGEFRSFAIVR